MKQDVISLRKTIPFDVFDYTTLVAALSEYSKPRDKITQLLADGSVVRIKKGIYCFGETLRRQSISREYLANLMYGPSYVSFKYALAYHGLIPESVATVTSVTNGRSREFNTPFGRFTYQTMTKDRFNYGANLVESDGITFMIAAPEKALPDEVWADKRHVSLSLLGMEEYVLHDLRLDTDKILGFNMDKLQAVGKIFASRKIDILVRAIERIRSRTHA